MLGIFYENFCREYDRDKKYNKTPLRENIIYEYYKNLEIDLIKSDLQFSKYNLYTIDGDCEIFVALPSRIIDNKNKIQFMIDIPMQLLQMLADLKKDGHIQDLALLANSQDPIESEQHISIELGNYKNPAPIRIQDVYYYPFPGIEQDTIKEVYVSDDKLFSSDVIYKFHEENKCDAIWIFSEGNSVEFEEVLEKSEILEDCVVTQLVHLEYLKDDDRVKISHIDHEYLFYSYDEFEQRNKNHNQRAGAKKRIKTFKVDNSRIPLVLPDGTFSLYTILDAWFSKAYLVQNFLVNGCGILDVEKMVRQVSAK